MTGILGHQCEKDPRETKSGKIILHDMVFYKSAPITSLT